MVRNVPAVSGSGLVSSGARAASWTAPSLQSITIAIVVTLGVGVLVFGPGVVGTVLGGVSLWKVVNIPSPTCPDVVCPVGNIKVSDGISPCGVCTPSNFTAGPAHTITNLTGTGMGVSAVVDGIGDDLVIADFDGAGYSSVAFSSGRIVVNTTLPPTFKEHCTAAPSACPTNWFVGWNGTCYLCTPFVMPAGFLPLCGACSIGDYPRLSANSSCYDCAPLPTQTPISSVGPGVSSVANGTAQQLKSSVAGSGIAINATDATYNTISVTADVMRTCSPSIPTCGLKEFVWSNGTCHYCAPIPASYIEMCGTCVAGQMLVWGPNSTCAVCQAIPTFSTQCVGVGDCAVSTINGDIKSLLFTEGFQTSSTIDQLRVDLAAHVMRRCNSSCVTGYTPVWNGTSTCFECANVTGSISVGSISAGSESGLNPILDGIGPDYSIAAFAFNGEGVSSSLSGGLISMNLTLPATLLRGCSANPVCASNERLFSNGTCVFCYPNEAIPDTYVQRCGLCSPGDILVFSANSTCAYCTPAPTPFSIQSAGTGLSSVLNSNGTLRSITPGSGLVGSLTANEILLEVGQDVMRTCNTSCLTNYIPSWNGACWTCIPPTNITQTYPVSVGSGIEIFQNSTLMTIKDLTYTGLVTLTDGSDVNIDVRPLQAAVADSLTPNLLAFNGTSPAFTVTTVSAQQYISETPHKGATFVSFPVIANLLSVSSTSIIWYHTRVNGGVGTMTGELMRTRITITMLIDTGGASGPFSFIVDDAGATDHLGLNGAFTATWAGGPLGCRTTPGFVAPTGTADVTLASPQNSFHVNGYAAISGTFLCSLVLFRETLI